MAWDKIAYGFGAAVVLFFTLLLIHDIGYRAAVKDCVQYGNIQLDGKAYPCATPTPER